MVPVRRDVGRRAMGGEAAPGDSIVHEVDYPHPPRRVWAALTDSAALARWLMPNDFQARVGHRFTFRVRPTPGWSGVVECRIVELDAPRRLAYTWRGDPAMPATLVTFSLEPGAAGGTRLRLEHSGFAAGGARGSSIRDLLDSGWGGLLREELPALLALPPGA